MSLGSLLKQARTSAGVSLDDLAAKTSIRMELIRDFEKDDFSKSGGETYARGHVRILANALGVTPSLWLDAFDEEHSVTKRAMAEMLIENNVMVARSEKPKLSLKTLSIISAAAVFLGVTGQLVVTNFRSTPAVVEKVATSSPSASPTTIATPTPATTQSAAVSVSITAARGNSWLFVSDSQGAMIYSGELAKGQSKIFSNDQPISIRFGSAGAVDVTVNGAAIASLGAIGEVLDRTFGANSSN